MMKKRYFGTDGIRGRLGQAPMTPDFMLKLGWAAGKVLGTGGDSRVLIGKDTRISGYMFESALEAGFSAAGVDILLLGPMPTPAVAYLTHTFHAAAGIVISASHNPYHDNGIKFFSADGCKLPDETELAIEAKLEEPLTMPASEQLGKARRIEDAAGRYIEFCKSALPAYTSLHGLKVVVDCANGATYHIAPEVLSELGADVIAIGVHPDGLNINEGCGSTAPGRLCQAVLDHEADLGIALDGDGDRVVMVDHLGTVLDGDELLYIITQARKQDGRIQGGVVGTVMSNLGLEEAIHDMGLEFERSPVGDRYVLKQLKQRGWSLGGESSGHIICLDRTTTGDGIIAALQVLHAMRQSDVSLKVLKSGLRKYPQAVVNVAISSAIDPQTLAPVQQAIRDAERKLNGHGRVLLRPSGTEPMVRVMVEGEDNALVDALARQLAGAVDQAIRSIPTMPA